MTEAMNSALRDGTAMDGPSKGMGTMSLLSSDERLKGRPRLCSDCGLCDSAYRARMASACMFVDNRSATIEQRLHGRTRRPGDELRFGIFRQQLMARMRRPRPNVQWSGIVTSLAARLLERGEVEAVITTAAAPGTRFKAEPRLARTPAEVLATAGNKPSLSPNLALLDTVRAQGIRRLAFIGTSCQVHALRAMEERLDLERLAVIGIPCSDNVAYPDLEYFLRQISRSPETIVHYEFMQDFSLWLRHENGRVERVNYIDFPMDRLHGIFPSACLSCFDYANGLADLTVGYMGAPLGWQWLLARTATGEWLLDTIRPELECTEPTHGGDRRRGMPRFIARLAAPPGAGRPPWLIRRMVARMQRKHGPQGLEFARAIIEMKMLRNLHHMRERFARQEQRVVPAYVYQTLAPYAETYRETFGREIEADNSGRPKQTPAHAQG